MKKQELIEKYTELYLRDEKGPNYEFEMVMKQKEFKSLRAQITPARKVVAQVEDMKKNARWLKQKLDELLTALEEVPSQQETLDQSLTASRVFDSVPHDVKNKDSMSFNPFLSEDVSKKGIQDNLENLRAMYKTDHELFKIMYDTIVNPLRNLKWRAEKDIENYLNSGGFGIGDEVIIGDDLYKIERIRDNNTVDVNKEIKSGWSKKTTTFHFQEMYLLEKVHPIHARLEELGIKSIENIEVEEPVNV